MHQVYFISTNKEVAPILNVQCCCYHHPIIVISIATIITALYKLGFVNMDQDVLIGHELEDRKLERGVPPHMIAQVLQASGQLVVHVDT